MKTTQFGLKALSLSVAAIALHAGAAQAGTVGIYGGGSTLSYTVDDVIGQCVGVQNSGSPITNPDSAKATATVCGGTAPLNSSYEYLLSGTGSGAALTALTTNTPTTAAAKSGEAYIDSANGFGAYPYPSWQLSFSDAPLDSPDPATVTGVVPGSTATQSATGTSYLAEYTSTLKSYRGQLWQIPVTATPIALPYHLPNASFGTGFYASSVPSVTVSNSATVSATVPVLDLSTDMVCYIWTQHTSGAKGIKVPGNYTWDNAIFTGVKTASGVIKSFDSNLISSSVTGVPIQPVVRSDASGTTYLFTLWLSQHCQAGYAAAGYSTPATLVTWPSFVTADGLTGNGGGGLSTTVLANNGAIGYITPDTILPAKSGANPAAFVLAGPDTPATVGQTSPSFLYPNGQNTSLAESGVSLPTGILATSWGTKLNTKFFLAAAKDYGYPITGLTYVMGYTCYDDDTTNNTYAGVEAYLNELATVAGGSLFKNNGFAPLTSADYASAVTIVEKDLKGVLAVGVVNKKGVVTAAGPAACNEFAAAGNTNH